MSLNTKQNTKPGTRRRAALAASRRNAFTLLELLLSLTLIVIATGLIGYILQLYSRNFVTQTEKHPPHGAGKRRIEHDCSRRPSCRD